MIRAAFLMKMTGLRRSITGMYLMGVVAGAVAAVSSLGLGWTAPDDPSAGAREFAMVFGGWGLAWLVVPLIFGRDPLRPEYFALLPIRPRKLAVTLLAASFIGILAVVSLVAFLSLAVYGARLGPVELLVGVAGALLLLLFVNMLSRVVIGVFGEGMKSRVGRELVAMQFAALICFASVWPLMDLGNAEQASNRLEAVAEALETAALIAPTGWAPVAMEAVTEGNWLLAIGALAGLAALSAVLLVAWSRLLERRLTIRQDAAPGPGWSGGLTANLFARFTETPVTGVAHKEVLTWFRDPWRALELRTCIWTAALLAVIVWLIGLPELLPFAGVALAAWAVLGAVNLYGLDGTAIRQTLTAPGASMADVRGRQLAWLIVFGPISVLITVVVTLVSGGHDTWVWTLAILPALLGGGSGVAVVVSVVAVAPLLDPQRRSGAYDSTGDNFFQVLAGMIMTAAVALPPVAVVLLGEGMDSAMVSWLGVPAGLASGGIFGWVLGYVAGRRLESQGPELLATMRSGGRKGSKRQEPVPAPE